jgi:predicted phage terminase large subunit-like protein
VTECACVLVNNLRARIPSSAAESGTVRLVHGSWTKAFLEEVEAFPLSAHDDQVDALSGAFSVIDQNRVGAYSMSFGHRPY